jgi:acetyl-CoA carboxylase biotin carboxyl carrier protein
MSGDAPDQDQLTALCEAASSLVARVPKGLSRVALHAGEYTVELEWEMAPVAAGAHAGSSGATGVSGAVAPAEGGTAGAAEVPDNRHAIVAVLVGTFYRQAEPGAPPFVEVGDVVEEGQDVAIIEAMKVMNRIQADRSGRVAEILVENGEMVEYEQRLIMLEPLEATEG